MRSPKEIYTALIDGKTLVNTNGRLIKLSESSGYLVDYIADKDAWLSASDIFSQSSMWSIKKEPRVFTVLCSGSGVLNCLPALEVGETIKVIEVTE